MGEKNQSGVRTELRDGRKILVVDFRYRDKDGREKRYRREFGSFYQFLLAFYDMQQDEDSYFWKARKVVCEGTVQCFRIFDM